MAAYARTMKLLFIGGTGVISAACAQRAVEPGFELHVLNRGVGADRPVPHGATVHRADVRDRDAVRAAVGGRDFDVVANFLAHTPEDVGDGTSLWTLTHGADFAKGFTGLLGHPQAIGDSFHITSDEVLTWNQIVETLAAAAGAEPRIVHVTSETILAADERWGRSLLGDKAHSMVFDNGKLRSVVPDYVATIPFARGAREIVAWHDEDAARRRVDPAIDALLDRLVA